MVTPDLTISVITPAYNCARHIAACVHSVIGQGLDGCEHVIMDGGSTDGTREIIAALAAALAISAPFPSRTAGSRTP
jgi:glycosyltransferase involved in cell wall biosynthesis